MLILFNTKPISSFTYPQDVVADLDNQAKVCNSNKKPSVFWRVFLYSVCTSIYITMVPTQVEVGSFLPQILGLICFFRHYVCNCLHFLRDNFFLKFNGKKSWRKKYCIFHSLSEVYQRPLQMSKMGHFIAISNGF